MNPGMTRWKGQPLYPYPTSPVQSCRKFSAVLGTTSLRSCITIRPAISSPIFISKKTLGFERTRSAASFVFKHCATILRATDKKAQVYDSSSIERRDRDKSLEENPALGPTQLVRGLERHSSSFSRSGYLADNLPLASQSAIFTSRHFWPGAAQFAKATSRSRNGLFRSRTALRASGAPRDAFSFRRERRPRKKRSNLGETSARFSRPRHRIGMRAAKKIGATSSGHFRAKLQTATLALETNSFKRDPF